MEPCVLRQNVCPSIADIRDLQPLRAGSTCMGLPSIPLAITDTEGRTVPVKHSPANRERCQTDRGLINAPGFLGLLLPVRHCRILLGSAQTADRTLPRPGHPIHSSPQLGLGLLSLSTFCPTDGLTERHLTPWEAI